MPRLEVMVPAVEQERPLDLDVLVVFGGVAPNGSFTTAAAGLGMPKSTVSRKVTELETRLKARLLNRTTRKVGLTDVGRTYYDYCARIVGEIEDAERAVSNLQEVPRGVLRLTTGPNVAFLGPILNDYMLRYPEVRIEMFCTSRPVDLIEERFDVALRAGALSDSTLVARSLGPVRWFLVGTPAYLKKRGRPRSVEDLKQHACIMFGIPSGGATLRLELLAVEGHLLRLHGDDGVYGHLEVPRVLDVDGQPAAVPRDVADGSELLWSPVRHERLEPDLDLLAHRSPPLGLQ